MAATATERLVAACNGLRLSTIPKDWTDQVWQSDFCEPQSLPEVLENGVVECAYFVEDLENFLAIARQWIKSDADSSSEGLWKVLTDNGFSHRTLIAVLHSFIESCDKSSYVGPKLQSCALAANIYIVLVQVPGSGAYKVFHPLLFQKALDVIRLWPQKESNKRKRGEATSGRRTRARHGRGSIDIQDDDQDMGDNVSDESHFDGDHDNQINSEQTKTSVKAKLLSLLQDAVLLLSCYSLKDFEQTLHHVLQLFVEITRLDPRASISSAYDYHGSQIYSVKSMASLAYIGLNKLSSPFHGSEGVNTRTVFKHLLGNLLMVSHPSFVNNGVIVQDVLVIKDQTVDFVCHLITKKSDNILNAVQVLIQHLCTKCPEKAEYRNVVSKVAVSIMRMLPQNLYARLIAWISKYSKNAKFCCMSLRNHEAQLILIVLMELKLQVNYRIFALDLIMLLVLDPERPLQEAENSFDDNTKKLLSKNYLIDIVVARCSDKAPTVRAKALQCFSQCATSDNSLLVAIVKQMLHKPLVRPAEGTPSGNNQRDVKQTEIRSISSIIRKRNCDEKVGVRKAALQALQSVIVLNLDSLEREDVLMLHDRCMDPALSVRRQAMMSLTSLLRERPSCTMVHSLWLDGVMPLVIDRETTAQEKCFQILEEVLLSNITAQSRSTGQNYVLAWNLLDRIASPDGQEVRRYLHFAFQHWSKQNKLPGSLVKGLMSHIDSEHNKAAWLLLAEIGSTSNKLDHSFVIKCWNEYTQGAKDYDCETVCRLLQVIGSLASDLSSAVVDTLVGDLQCKLVKFDCSPDVIAATIATLCKLCKAHPCAAGTSDDWCADLLKATEEFLSSVMLQQDSMDEELVTRHLFTVGEVAQLAPSKTTERLFMFVESILISHNNKQDADPLQKFNLSPTVKAHAFVTLGKLCLQNEDLAKQCIAALARELETSSDPAIRNNVTVVMCDLCVRYTSLVDRYVPNIAACLKDSAPLVRRQTLTLLTHLLQEDFVKWKGSLFYRFVTTLVDDDHEIRKFADFCLVHLLLSRHPGMLFQHFVECVFHFNSFEKHKVKASSYMAIISKRFIIYQFMLVHMSDEDRFHLTGKLCQEVLGGFTDGLIKLDDNSGPVLKDALSILSCKNIKLSSMRTKATEDIVDEGDMAAAAILQARNKFLTQVLKKNMVENIIPIIVELKHMLEKEHSPLLRDLMSCLKEVMKDYRSEVKDVLCADRQLANEIEFDLKRFEEQQKELDEQLKRPSPPHSSPQVVSSPLLAAGRSPARVTAIVAPQLRTAAPSPKHKDCNRTRVTPLAQALNQMQSTRRHTVATTLNTKSPLSKALLSNITVPISPLQSKYQQSLSTAALINSARKAVEHAKAAAEQQKTRSVCHENGPQVDGTGSEGSPKRTPLSPVNLRTFQKSGEERAASTPEGERSHLSRISFCANVSIVAPPSPIPSSLPIRLLPKDKDTQPSWIERKSKEEVGEDDEEIICMMSPEQKLPKPRTWNIKSPDPKKQISSTKAKTNEQNDSVSRRTRSRRK